MQLAALVATTDDVGATSARKAKVALLADLLGSADPAEMEVAVGLIAGDPRQGRIGVGWATVAGLDVEPADGASHSVADLDQLLTEVAATHGAGSKARRDELLRAFLLRATAAEVDFIRRLLVGELRQGANAGVATDAVAKAVGVPTAVLRRAVMLCGDLRVAAHIAAAEGRGGLEAIGLELFRPIQPMLASTASSVAEAMAELGEASTEWKLDGVRIQVHRSGDVVRIWTRNLNEITDGLAEVAKLVRTLPVQSVVLDGEVLGIADDGRPFAFQDTVSNEHRSLHPFFFDILHVDGTDLIDAPLDERRIRLDEVCGTYATPGVLGSNVDDAQAVLDDALSRGHEGVVIKAADSAYQAGRRGKTWRKVKPVHTLDLVVLAVERGSGRREGWLSNIHLGARGPDGEFVMVGKTFKGMTDATLRWQTERFWELALSDQDDDYVIRVRPEQVVEIAVDGVQRSTRYPGGVALRFARVVRYRDDKEPSGADTIDSVRSLGH